MGILQEHVQVSAALVEPLLGNEIARAVLCHHERWDGRGYPNGLSGEEIPRLSRIIQICDAYEMMIAAGSVKIGMTALGMCQRKMRMIRETMIISSSSSCLSV